MNQDKTNLYVAFDDSNTDPTYSPADSVYLVVGPSEVDTNPCAQGVARLAVPLLPRDNEQLEAFAAAMGWDVEYDNEGQAVIYTGMYQPTE